MNQYTVVSKLGEGAFSTVYRVKRKEDGREYALKKMRIASLSEKEVANCLNEVRILASLSSPFILAYRDSFFDELTNCFCIVTECLEGGDIFQLITRSKVNRRLVDESLIWRVAQQALKGLEALHSVNVLHRDIKSANIFLTKDQAQVKLADMNVSIVTANGMARTQTGTPYYASPEVWLEKPYSNKCDIWSLGCVLYEMAALKPPFVSHDLKSLKKTIISGVYKRIPTHYSDDLEALIRLCLKVDPKDRPAAAELLENDLLRRRAGHSQGMSESACLNSSLTRKLLLEKIVPPRRKDFRNINERLPKHKFEHSVDKISENRSYCEEKNKENVGSVANTGKITKKDVLPNIQRSSSVNSRKSDRLRLIEEKLIVICEDRPPLPTKKPLRA
jgi:NIMA (never in mitosis gene a)-related kinase 1/4/5